jgi:hypothetical protein
MSPENEPIPTNIVVPISTLEDAQESYQSIFYDTSWESSNYAPVLPVNADIGYLYMKSGG